MMAAGREKDQADFDLERFIEMFDEALTSNDERVINALRSLMMMVILTKSETGHQGRMTGPLKRLFEDNNQILRRLERMESEVREVATMNRRYGATATGYSSDIWKQQPHQWAMTEEQSASLKDVIKGMNTALPTVKKQW